MMDRLGTINDNKSQFACAANSLHNLSQRKLNSQVVDKRQEQSVTMILLEFSSKCIDKLFIADDAASNASRNTVGRAGRP
jgi:hypothetical protein